MSKKDDQINELMARVTVLEDKMDNVVRGYSFVADELRNLFGFGHIALVFDAISAKFCK